MKLVCSQTELSSSLQLVSRAVAGRPTHPVLANVLLTADAATGRLSLTGFDLNLGIQTSLPAAVEASGAITLPARLFGEIVSRLSADSPLTLSCPEGEELVKGLRATLFSSSGDDAKQILTGVHLRLAGEGLECAATDGHRLAVQRLDKALAPGNETVLAEGEEPFAVTVPARSLRELERLLSGRPSDEPLSLFSERGQVVVLWADQVLTSRTIDGTYPNYRQLLPETFNRRLVLDRRAFTASLERVAVLADQHNNVVKISSDPAAGQVLIRADAQDVGSGSEGVAAVIEGEAIEIAFNVRYLLEGLKAMAADQVVLQCNGPTTPAVLAPVGEDGSFTYLVMPVQIRS